MDEELWVGSVIVSGLDCKVWVCVLPETDTYTGTMQASTSLRKCKRYVETTGWSGSEGATWKKNENGDWDAYVKEV